MTNEEKALELAELNEIPDEEERYYNRFKSEVYDKCLEMGLWKDKESGETGKIFFLKACYFLDKAGLLKDFDWLIKANEFQKYVNNQ